VQDQTKGLDFIWELLYSLQKQNLDLSKFVDTVTDSAPSMTGSINGVVSSLQANPQVRFPE